jgi:hydroxylamine dehydrogenase
MCAKSNRGIVWLSLSLVLGLSPVILADGAIALSELSEESKACIECHKQESPSIYQQWGASKHYRGNVACYECHAAQASDKDAYMHYDIRIATIVSPKDCSRCHEREVKEFIGSHHARGGRIIGSLDNVLAEVVEGNRGMKTMGFPGGVSAAAVNGCWQCHGSTVKVLAEGKLDPATWPNTGIGRVNPDGSEGACSACHSRHSFSAAQARHPDTCGKCHLGPDHPQKEIYEESKHGIAFAANVDKMNMDSAKWIVGEDYTAAPTCATCHMSATRALLANEAHPAIEAMPVTHDIGMRISWNNRPVLSIRPEVSDAKMNLPGKDVHWTKRRADMQNVCSNCHSKTWVDNWYVQYDGLIDLYNNKYAKPGQALYNAAKPLIKPVKFGNKIDFTWFELWHHEGRRARHGASMMGPDYTHWHGTYDLAKHFYVKYVPELEDLIEKYIDSSNAEKKAAAENLKQVLDDILNSEDHKWFLGKMDPAEDAKRKKAAADFKARYD